MRTFNITSKEDLAYALRYARLVKGLSLEDVHRATGLAVSSIHRIEKTEINVSTSSLLKLMDFYDMVMEAEV